MFFTKFLARISGASKKPAAIPGFGPSATLTVRVTRDDVHPGDPAEPRAFLVPADIRPEDLLREIADRGWLPRLYESVVVWSVWSNEPLAVVEHDCRSDRGHVTLLPLPDLDRRMRAADRVDDEIRLRFRYHPYLDTQTAFARLSSGSRLEGSE